MRVTAKELKSWWDAGANLLARLFDENKALRRERDELQKDVDSTIVVINPPPKEGKP